MTLTRNKPLKRKAPRRDWRKAIAKRYAEGQCRVCDTPLELESAHLISRRCDEPDGSGVLVVHEDSTVPLCSPHHRSYDAHGLDLLPYITLAEQVRAVYEAGGIEAARKRLTGGRL